MIEHCAVCRFFLTPANRGEPGVCRRYPPTVFLQMSPPNIIGKPPNLSMLTEFPRVPPNGWCGDWQMRVEGSA